MIRTSLREICANYYDAYCRQKPRDGEYPTEFVDGLSDNGWMGILVPEEDGDIRMGTPEVVV